MISWLNSGELAIELQVRGRSFQTVVLAADAARLWEDITTLPELVSTDEGPPSPLHRWYGRLENQLVVVEADSKPRCEDPFTVSIHIELLDSSPDHFDWKILIGLSCLPKSIMPTRPMYIESRTVLPSHAVYRPDPRGWSDTIYKAQSRMEADSLLEYLRRDPWNDKCFVGEPERPGEWAIVRQVAEGEQIVGAYADRNAAIRVAREYSLTDKSSTFFTVKNLQDDHATAQYVITRGLVMPCRQ